MEYPTGTYHCRLDEKARLVIPRESVRILEITSKTPIGIYLEGKQYIHLEPLKTDLLKEIERLKSLPPSHPERLGVVGRVYKHMDKQGRVVIPEVFRGTLGIKEKDLVNVFLNIDCLTITGLAERTLPRK